MPVVPTNDTSVSLIPSRTILGVLTSNKPAAHLEQQYSVAIEAAPVTVTARLPLLDSLRGFAMILMAVYHFCFDLNHFGVLQQSMNLDPFWLNFRNVIMTAFTTLVGVSFILSRAQYNKRSYWYRLLRVAGCAVLISSVTFIQFGDRWVFFGILHFVVIATLIGPLITKVPRACLAIGIGVIALPIFYRSVFFFQPLWIITGLSPLNPMTEDFAPLFPWMGTVLIGVFAGWFCLSRNFVFTHMHWKPISRLGQHSLLFYMTHQLVLYPLAWLIAQIT